MNRKFRILFLSQPAIGHVHPMIAIALQMRSEGHDVQFLVPGRTLPFKMLEELAGTFQILRSSMAIPARVAGYGFPVDLMPAPLTISLRSVLVPYTSGYFETRFSMDLINRGVGAYTRFLLNYLSSRRFDVMVSDFSLTASHIASEKTGIPCAVVLQAGLPYRGEGVPPYGSGLPIGAVASKEHDRCVRIEKRFLKRLDQRLDRVRKQWGLPSFPEGFLRVPYSQWLNLVLTASAIEAPRSNLTDSTFFVGPCFKNWVDSEHDFPFERLQKNKFKVYVSLGSLFNNKPHVFRAIMRALDHPEYQVIISAVGAYRRLVKEVVPNNVLLFPWLSHSLLPEMDMVIGHGGNNSTNETLAAGKPLIVIPIGGDQGDNARRVEYLGVGLRIGLSALTKEIIESKVKQIRTDPRFGERALELKRELDKTDGPATASKLIQLLAEAQAPIKRPAGAPLTITREDYRFLDEIAAGI